MSRASARAPRPRHLVAALLPLLSAPVVLAVLTPVARAGCDASAPVAGQIVTCTASASNPQATPVLLGPGATGVTVNVLAGAQLATANANTLYIDPAAGAVINNQGSIAASGTVGSGTAAGINADAVVTVNNAASGSITSAQGFALYLLGGSTVVNEGSISAPVGYGLAFKGAGDSTLLNRGSISGGSGGVQFGSGNDRMQMLAGTVSSVEQGEGDDRLQVSGGTITGLVQQGNGRDDFVMTGGTVGALQQGDGTDTFTLSGGRIIGAFEDGDRAWMTGGRIGRVNMKLKKKSVRHVRRHRRWQRGDQVRHRYRAHLRYGLHRRQHQCQRWR
ncbi:MAG: hypothetical protein GAK31_02299 [Stenotrophomonas maltophilia]|uniref:Autotransporter outer membrane beta-barrel domain-containing protein n=1 Tax=Stenotrophomonas maltophilia TaxID=40324 RepID=A0A7V8FFZ4_STEMA|nr:MAG: hypothetical protein GAK31_02299 [Stenotrophomonas maltophilia]